LIGFPISLWAVYRVSGILKNLSLSTMIKAAIYVYVFFVGLNLFRIFFSYSRWVFPKIELESDRSSPLRHRGIWGAIVLAVALPLATDVFFKVI
jgi:hypothetical protein